MKQENNTNPLKFSEFNFSSKMPKKTYMSNSLMQLRKQNFPKNKQDKLTDLFLYFLIEVLKHKRYKEIQHKLTQSEAMIFLFKMNFFRDHSTQKSTKTKTVFHTIPFNFFLPNQENKMS